MTTEKLSHAPSGTPKLKLSDVLKALAFDPAKMETDQMLQPLGGRDCVTGERIEVVHADDCRRIELKKIEQSRELAEQSNELNEVVQILGRLLTGEPTGIHIGHAADMARKVAEKYAPSEMGEPEDELRFAERTSAAEAATILLTALGWESGGLAAAAAEIVKERDDLKHDMERNMGFANRYVNEMQRISDWVDERTVNATGDVRAMLEDLRHELDEDGTQPGEPA